MTGSTARRLVPELAIDGALSAAAAQSASSIGHLDRAGARSAPPIPSRALSFPTLRIAHAEPVGEHASALHPRRSARRRAGCAAIAFRVAETPLGRFLAETRGRGDPPRRPSAPRHLARRRRGAAADRRRGPGHQLKPRAPIKGEHIGQFARAPVRAGGPASRPRDGRARCGISGMAIGRPPAEIRAVEFRSPSRKPRRSAKLENAHVEQAHRDPSTARWRLAAIHDRSAQKVRPGDALAAALAGMSMTAMPIPGAGRGPGVGAAIGLGILGGVIAGAAIAATAPPVYAAPPSYYYYPQQGYYYNTPARRLLQCAAALLRAGGLQLPALQLPIMPTAGPSGGRSPVALPAVGYCAAEPVPRRARARHRDGAAGLTPLSNRRMSRGCFDPRRDGWKRARSPRRYAGKTQSAGVEADANFRKFTGIYLGIVAMLLAITSLGGSNATKVDAECQHPGLRHLCLLPVEIHPPDRISAGRRPARRPARRRARGCREAAKAKIEDMIKRWRAKAERYESDPVERPAARRSCSPPPRNGKPGATAPPDATRISTSPRRCFRSRSCWARSAIVAASRPLVRLSGVLAVLAVLLMLNGYFLLVQLPLD